MSVSAIDRLQELQDAVIALLGRIDKLEADTGTDLLPLRMDVEAILSRLHRAGHDGSTMGAVRTFDKLVTLDGGFKSVEKRWSEVRRNAGLAAAEEILEGTDLYAGWRSKWDGSVECAWRVRGQVEDRETRSESRTRARPGSEAMPFALALDLRYGADLPLARIAELFDLSASAVQARIASFESRVGEEMAKTAIQEQLPQGWVLDSRTREGDFELRRNGDRGATEKALYLQVVAVWSERDPSAGRPREAGLTWGPGMRASRIWIVVFFDGPRITYVPQDRPGPYASGGSMSHLPIERIIRLAPELGYDTLAEAIHYLETGATEGGFANGRG